MTHSLDLGRKRHPGNGGTLGVGTVLPKGAKLIKPSGTPPDPLGTVEQWNSWSASVVALSRCSAVSGEWAPSPSEVADAKETAFQRDQTLRRGC